MKRTYTTPAIRQTKIETACFIAISGEEEDYKIVIDNEENGPSDKGTSSSFDNARSKRSDLWD